jgi:catechol 1,2-dioxygenase
MAGSLGVSSLVCLLNDGDNGATKTSQSLLGPFWRMRSPRVENGGSINRSDTPGPNLLARFRVEDREGARSKGPRSTSGIPRRSASTRTRIPSRPT